MTRENVAEHVIALLFGIEHGIESLRHRAKADRSVGRRRRARASAGSARKAGHSNAARFPLVHRRILDRLLEVLPRITSDAESINAATRKLIAL
ncbi:hypothetical protein ACFRAO_36505 [Streptomyces sp. NPDC056656]|uniref:hypothetical protein n=1 Tax=Streptomyces sp. NPDC056656 TaxID=3345895 RepID=UPI0036C0B020